MGRGANWVMKRTRESSRHSTSMLRESSNHNSKQQIGGTQCTRTRSESSAGNDKGCRRLAMEDETMLETAGQLKLEAESRRRISSCCRAVRRYDAQLLLLLLLFLSHKSISSSGRINSILCRTRQAHQHINSIPSILLFNCSLLPMIRLVLLLFYNPVSCRLSM